MKKFTLCSLCIYRVIWLCNAGANSGFAWKLREFLLVWKKGYVSIIYSFSQNSPCCTLFSNGQVRCIPDCNGESFWALLFRLMGLLSILFSTCGHLSRTWSIRVEVRKKELQAASLCRSMVSFRHAAAKSGRDVHCSFQGLCQVSGLGASTAQDGCKFGLGSISGYFLCRCILNVTSMGFVWKFWLYLSDYYMTSEYSKNFWKYLFLLVCMYDRNAERNH